MSEDHFLSDDDTTHKMEPAASQTSGVLRKACLVCLAGWEIGKEIEIEKEVHVLGRSSDADTVIDSPSVSRAHAKILRVRKDGPEQFGITDLKSSNGTRVNNVLVSSAHLHNGDKILLGDILFKFVLEDEVEARFFKNVHRLIHHHQLTGLLTMDTFRRKLDAELRRSGFHRPMTIAMTDLDGLKEVNDTYGHIAGTMVVREMGHIIRQTLRKKDLPALYGGDETIILYPDTTIVEAVQLAERLRRTMETRMFEYEGRRFRVTISQGLAEWPTHGRTVEDLIAAADRALYAAKSQGRNCLRCAGN
jgi:diguanylate cyclase (GGDEF)-like protein